MHVLFCSTVFFIGLPCDSTRTIKGLVKVLCLIPSCIAKLVTSTVLKFCKLSLSLLLLLLLKLGEEFVEVLLDVSLVIMSLFPVITNVLC